MGNTFGFLHTEAEGGFQFTVAEVCKAADINLNETCNLVFNAGHELMSIGNVIRGTMEAKPGIAGIGIWYAMILFFGVITIALVFAMLEITKTSTTFSDSSVIAFFTDTKKQRKLNIFRAAGRTFVLGVSDTQTIFVGAFLLNLAGQSKCQLTSYHFTVAVSQMMIGLSVMTFSVALIRTYWRNPLAALFRLLLSIGCFIGVGFAIFRKANYAPDWPPPSSRKDSVILLPVACLLESTLRSRAESQAKQGSADLDFGSSTKWPYERWFFIALVIAFLQAHVSILSRFVEKKNHARAMKNHTRAKNRTRAKRNNCCGFVTAIYWFCILTPPTFTSVWCWIHVYQAREWVRKSGWIGSPNPEMIIWDLGQLVALGLLVTVIMNMLTEAMKREAKGSAFERVLDEEN